MTATSAKINYFLQHYAPHGHPQAQPAQPISTGSPESPYTTNSHEQLHIQEYKEPEIPPDLHSHLQHATPPVTIPHDIPLQPAATPPTHLPPVTTLKLPLTEPEIEKNMHKKVTDAVRWLAVWCIRQLKIDQYKHLHPEENND